MFGVEHPRTIIAKGNLAVTYKDLGQIRDATTMQEEVLDASRRILGHNYPDTLMALANLAVSYRECGQVELAVKLEEEVLEMRTRLLRKTH